MFWILIMRGRYIWSIRKVDNKGSYFMFRNTDGDLSIILFFIVVLNKSMFERYKLAYQPILRYFQVIILGMFIAYCILQLTQLVVITKTSLITQQATISSSQINQCSVSKRLYGYKFDINYIKKDKTKSLMFITSRKNKEIIEKRIEQLNIKIV